MATAPPPTGNVELETQAQNALNPYLTGGIGSSGALDAAKAAFEQQMLPFLQNQMTLAGVAESPLAVQSYGNVLAGQMVPLIQNDMQNQLQAVNQAMGLSGQQFQQGYLPWQAEGQAELARQKMALEERLGLGQQGVQREGQQLQYKLGLSGQDVQRMLGMSNIDLQRELGLGQLGLGHEQLDQSGVIAGANIADQQAARQLQAYQMAIAAQLGLANPYASAMGGQQQQQQMGLQGYSQAGSLQQNTAQQYMDAIRQEILRLQGMGEQGSYGVFGGAAVPPALGTTSSTTGSSSK